MRRNRSLLESGDDEDLDGIELLRRSGQNSGPGQNTKSLGAYDRPTTGLEAIADYAQSKRAIRHHMGKTKLRRTILYTIGWWLLFNIAIIIWRLLSEVRVLNPSANSSDVDDSSDLIILPRPDDAFVWTLMLNGAALVLLVAWAIIRLLLALLHLIGSCLPAVNVLASQMRSIHVQLIVVLWSICCNALLSTVPYLIDRLSNIAMQTLSGLFEAALMSALLYISVIVILHFLSLRLYRAIEDRIHNSAVGENLVIKFETPGGLLNRALGMRVVDDSSAEMISECFQQVKQEGAGSAAFDAVAVEILAKWGKDVIVLADLEAKGFDRETGCLIMQAFGSDALGHLTKELISDGLQLIFRERREVLNLKKSKTLFLDAARVVLTVLWALGSLVIFLLVLGFNITSVFVPLFSTLVAVSFAYASTLQEIFDSLYMIFFGQPFSLGDMLLVVSSSFPTHNELLVVERVGLLSTIFKTLNGEVIYMRNGILSKAKIINLNAASKISFGVQFFVHEGTTAEQMALLQTDLVGFLTDIPTFSKKHSLDVTGINEGMSCSLRVFLKGVTWQQRSKWKQLRSQLILFLQGRLNAHGLKADREPSILASPLSSLLAE